MLSSIFGFLRATRPIVQYMYYLRFSLFMLLAAPAIAYVDHSTPLIHAIFTPEKFGQFLGCGFFTTCSGCMALVLARIVCLNGGVRFKSDSNLDVPVFLKKWLGEESESHSLAVLIIFQLPGLALLWRLYTNAQLESVPIRNIALVYMLAGVAVAFAFFYIVTLFYYWSFPFTDFGRSARTLLLPRSCFGLPDYITGVSGHARPYPLQDNIEQLGALPTPVVLRPLEWLFRKLAQTLGSGYHETRMPSLLLEGHRFAVIAVIGYLIVYTALFPFTAPVKQPTGNSIAFLGLCVFFALLASSFLHKVELDDTQKLSYSLAPGCVKISARRRGATAFLAFSA